MEFEEIQKKLKNILTEKRYKHSVGAMKAAGELAKIYGENEEEARFAGLIHDIAKEMPKEQIYEYVKKHNIELDEIEEKQLSLVHRKIGSSIAKEEFGANEKIQNAIRYHTMGNVKMDRFAKIIYLADKIEETRNYEEVEKLRELAREDLDKAMLYVLDFTTEKCIRKGALIHPDTIALRNYLLQQLKS